MKRMEKIDLIPAETLFHKPLDHPRMIIEGILSNGLAILAGDSKIGKSWMVLWLCIQLANGEPVWGSPLQKQMSFTLHWKILNGGSRTACMS